jgi:hypothetical protein
MDRDADLERDACVGSERDFVAKYRHPFLVVHLEEDGDGAEFQTVASADFQPRPAEERIMRVVKRDGANQFSFITIGRAHNNDIVIGVKSVSKCHAVIKKTGERFAIADAGSKNGTELNGHILGRDPRAVKSGDEVRLSPRVSARFLDPKAAYRWIRAQADK